MSERRNGDTSEPAAWACGPGAPCSWCGEAIPAVTESGRRTRADAETYGRRCRQAIFRLRRRAAHGPVARGGGRGREVARARGVVRGARQGAEPMRVAYADPPYPGRARRWYGGEAEYAGEVDHRRLIAELQDGGYDGWALSTAADALRDLLPLCPPEVWLIPWVKPLKPSVRTRGLHNCWEALLVVGGRQQPPGVRDWICAQPARGGGTLPGRKPLEFCACLFEALGTRPGDELVDVFPGTAIVSRAWAQLSSSAAAPGDGSGAQLGCVAGALAGPDDGSDRAVADGHGDPDDRSPPKPSPAAAEDLGDGSAVPVPDPSRGPTWRRRPLTSRDRTAGGVA